MQIILSHLYLGANTLQLGAFVQCRRQIETLIGAYDYHQHHKDVIHYGVDPGVNGLVWAAFVTWVLGFPQQAERYCREAIALAQICDHALTLTLALELGGGIVRILARDYAAAREDLDASLALAVEQGFGSFEAESRFYLGFLQVMAGDVDDGLAQMQQALAGWRATGMCIMTSVFLGLLAQAQIRAGQLAAARRTLDDALAWVAAQEERFYEVELHRLQGDLWRMVGRETAVVVAAYQQAITIARDQKAKSWELRTTISLAKLWLAQGKKNQVGKALHNIVDWFTEGFETADYQEAKKLMMVCEQAGA